MVLDCVLNDPFKNRCSGSLKMTLINGLCACGLLWRCQNLIGFVIYQLKRTWELNTHKIYLYNCQVFPLMLNFRKDAMTTLIIFINDSSALSQQFWDWFIPLSISFYLLLVFSFYCVVQARYIFEVQSNRGFLSRYTFFKFLSDDRSKGSTYLL